MYVICDDDDYTIRRLLLRCLDRARDNLKDKMYDEKRDLIYL